MRLPDQHPGKTREPLPGEKLTGLSPLEKFKAQLEAMGRPYTQSGNGYSACCPVHKDTSPSFAFSEGEDGKLMVRCFACEAKFSEIMEAVGLWQSDAFPEDGGHGSAASRLRYSPTDPPYFGQPEPEFNPAFTADSDAHEDALCERPDMMAELMNRLGVSEDSLWSLHAGWRQKNWQPDGQGGLIDLGPAWTFPEVNGRGQIIGIQRRFVDESIGKRVISGSKRGSLRSRRMGINSRHALHSGRSFRRRGNPDGGRLCNRPAQR